MIIRLILISGGNGFLSGASTLSFIKQPDHLVPSRRLRPGVGGDATELLTEPVVERREVCKSGSRHMPLNHVAGRVERVVIGDRDGGNPPLRKTPLDLIEDVVRVDLAAILKDRVLTEIGCSRDTLVFVQWLNWGFARVTFELILVDPRSLCTKLALVPS